MSIYWKSCVKQKEGDNKMENTDRGSHDNLEEHGKDIVGAPADALFFALGYLSGVTDLLNVEKVCKSFCDVVRDDPLLWRNIRIDHPLCKKITDDNLLQLTNRAQGGLHSLSITKCSFITNDGLKHVLESNLRLTKISLLIAKCAWML